MQEDFQLLHIHQQCREHNYQLFYYFEEGPKKPSHGPLGPLEPLFEKNHSTTVLYTPLITVVIAAHYSQHHHCQIVLFHSNCWQLQLTIFP